MKVGKERMKTYGKQIWGFGIKHRPLRLASKKLWKVNELRITGAV
jgi:hypothetical protein